MNEITPKEASEILRHYTNLGYGIIIEGGDVSKIIQALSLASKILENGTPYNPTGDLISREALKDITYINKGNFNTVEDIREWIDNAPTVEVRPQGEWETVEGIDGDEYYECSNCGEPWVLTAGTPKDNNMNFCPNCGADMKGGAE